MVVVFIKTNIQFKLMNIHVTTIVPSGSRGGLMVSALVSGSSGPSSSPGRGHCVVFLGGGGNPGGNPVMD